MPVQIATFKIIINAWAEYTEMEAELSDGDFWINGD